MGGGDIQINFLSENANNGNNQLTGEEEEYKAVKFESNLENLNKDIEQVVEEI